MVAIFAYFYEETPQKRTASDKSYENTMIFERQTNYKFNQPILKIHYFSPAFDDSVVLIAQQGIGKDKLVHYNSKSQLVYEYRFDDFVDGLSMPNDKQAVVLRPQQDFLFIFNLSNKTITKIKHYFFSQISCQCEVHYFCDSKLLCIHQNGDHETIKMTLNYYQWQTLRSQSAAQKTPDAVVTYEAGAEDWNPCYQVRKVNSHSKYAWCQPRHSGVFQVRIHEVVEGKGAYKIQKIDMTSLFQPYGIIEMEAAIVEMWEFTPHILLLYCATNKNEQGSVKSNKNVINNTFLWDLELRYIRETKFVLPQKYQDLQVDIVGTPSLSMFRTFCFQPGKAVPSPAFFVHNLTENIIKEETWVCSHIQKYTVLERSRDTIVQGLFQNSNVNELNIRTISLMVRKELSMFLLRHMEKQPKDEWDCDILIDIFKMLDYEQNQ